MLMLDGIQRYWGESRRCDHIETVPIDIGDQKQPYRSLILNYRCCLDEGHQCEHAYLHDDATVSLCDQA